MAGASVVVRFLADTKQLVAGAREAQTKTGAVGGALKGLGKAAALSAGAAGVGALVATLKIGVDEYSEAAKIGAQTNAVIKSTGAAAGVSADHVGDLATSIMRKSGIDDEAIQSGENLLLTFTNIKNEAGAGNDIFDQTTKVMADMATAMGQDPKTAAMQLGKALNDPVKGLSKLSKVGVTFTDAQKAQVEAMTKAGDTAGAQRIILAELNKEFGGSAEAAGKTLPGQLAIARQSFNNFAGMLVGKAVPAIQAVVVWLVDHWPQISAAISQAWAIIQPLLVAFGQLFAQVAQIVIDNWGKIAPIVRAVGVAIKAAVAVIVSVIKLLTALLRGDWSAAWAAAKDVVRNIVKLITALLRVEIAIWKAVLGAAWAAIKGATSAAWDAIKRAVTSAVQAVGSAIGQIPGKIRAFVASVGTEAAKIGGAIKDKIVGGVHDAVAAVAGIGDRIKRALDGIVGRVEAAAGRVASAIKSPINSVIKAWNGIVFHVPRFTVGGGSHLGVDIPKFTFGGQSINFPDLPTLAKGGVLTRPTLFVGGEAGREIVTPERLLREIVADGGGDTFQLTIHTQTVDAASVAYGFRRLELLRTGR